MAWVVDLMQLCNNTHGISIISTQKASHLRCMCTVQRINFKRSSITVVLFHHTNVYKLSDFFSSTSNEYTFIQNNLKQIALSCIHKA